MIRSSKKTSRLGPAEMSGLAEELQYLFSLRSRGWKLGLDTMHALADGLGRPERRYPSVLVAGTNGKGSSSAILASILRRAGLRTGHYTSPHLVDFRERIRVDGAAIPERETLDLVTIVRPLVEARGATFFEAAAAMAMRHFADRACDVAVLEVGLGGRLDATNIVDPVVSVITGIAMDHVTILGRTREAIAREKAGIIREGTRVVTGATDTALETIEAECRERGAPIVRLGRDVRLRVTRVSAAGTEFDLRGAGGGALPGGAAASADHAGADGHVLDVTGRWRTPLIGRHQAHNAACALLAARALAETGFDLAIDAARDGLESVRWPARFEIVAGEPTVVLDVAHNLEGARALAETWRAVFPERRPVLVAGMLADKDHEGFARRVFPLASHVIATEPKEERALAAGTLAERAAAASVPCEVAVPVADAVARARERAGRDGIVLVAGSLFTVGEAMEAMGYEGLERI